MERRPLPPAGRYFDAVVQVGQPVPGFGLVQLNRNVGGLHFLPALRNTDNQGLLDVTWYERTTGNTTLTNVEEAPGVLPNAVATPSGNVLINTVATDWNAVSSDIVPNFGDYTDNSVLATASYPYVGRKVGIAWADGRGGAPQAFFAER